MSRYRAIYVPLARPSPQFLNRNASAAIEKVPHSIDNLLSIASRSSSEISLGMDRKKERKKGERERERGNSKQEEFRFSKFCEIIEDSKLDDSNMYVQIFERDVSRLMRRNVARKNGSILIVNSAQSTMSKVYKGS